MSGSGGKSIAATGSAGRSIGAACIAVAAGAAGETPRQRTERERDARQLAAEEAFTSDPQVRQLIGQYGARIVPDSIRPFDDA